MTEKTKSEYTKEVIIC